MRFDRAALESLSVSPPRAAAGRSLAALLLGAVAIGFAPIFVRLSEVGPTATAFWRLTIALPVLVAWATVQKRRVEAPAHAARPARSFAWIGLAGCFFAVDLALWHSSIRFTSVANATLFANFAAIFVVLFSWFFLHERITRRFLFGCGAGVAGTILLAAGKVEFRAAGLLGDALGLGTAVFYGAYLIAVKKLRGTFSTAAIMSGSALVSIPILGGIAVLSHEKFAPETAAGWANLAALALLSHVAGQSLITFALAHLRASFSSVALLLQPFVAALAAWFWLNETLTVSQLVGGALILGAIAVARSGQPTKTRNA